MSNFHSPLDPKSSKLFRKRSSNLNWFVLLPSFETYFHHFIMANNEEFKLYCETMVQEINKDGLRLISKKKKIVYVEHQEGSSDICKKTVPPLFIAFSNWYGFLWPPRKISGCVSLAPRKHFFHKGPPFEFIKILFLQRGDPNEKSVFWS